MVSALDFALPPALKAPTHHIYPHPFRYVTSVEALGPGSNPISSRKTSLQTATPTLSTVIPQCSYEGVWPVTQDRSLQLYWRPSEVAFPVANRGVLTALKPINIIAGQRSAWAILTQFRIRPIGLVEVCGLFEGLERGDAESATA